MPAFTFPELADEVYAYCDLCEDFVYRQIPPDRRSYYIRAGIEMGRQAAQEYAGQDLVALMENDGVQILRLLTESETGIRSQICYDGKHRQLDLFAGTAAKISKALADTDCPLTAGQVEQMFLAHEFYHWLGYSSHLTSDLRCEAVRKKLLGLIPRNIRIRSTEEIAAFTFTKEWCNLSVHPKAIDYLLLFQGYGYSIRKIYECFQDLSEQYRANCL